MLNWMEWTTYNAFNWNFHAFSGSSIQWKGPIHYSNELRRQASFSFRMIADACTLHDAFIQKMENITHLKRMWRNGGCSARLEHLNIITFRNQICLKAPCQMESLRIEKVHSSWGKRDFALSLRSFDSRQTQAFKCTFVFNKRIASLEALKLQEQQEQ